MITFNKVQFSKGHGGAGAGEGHGGVGARGVGEGRAWGEDWEGEPYVHVDNDHGRIACWWSGARVAWLPPLQPLSLMTPQAEVP